MFLRYLRATRIAGVRPLDALGTPDPRGVSDHRLHIIQFYETLIKKHIEKPKPKK